MVNPGTNFDNLRLATADLLSSATILNTKLPRIQNLQGIEGTVAILARLDQLADDMRDVKSEVAGVKTGLAGVKSELAGVKTEVVG